jgi:hypothetical protein
MPGEWLARTLLSGIAGIPQTYTDGIHELLDIETARTTADTLTTLHDDLAHGWASSNQTITAVELPRVFGQSLKALREAVPETDPALVVSLGLSPRDDISVERVAINVNDGRRPVDEPIVPDGPAAYFSTLPIRRCVTEVQKQTGLKSEVSRTTGTVVCNWPSTHTTGRPTDEPGRAAGPAGELTPDAAHRGGPDDGLGPPLMAGQPDAMLSGSSAGVPTRSHR